EHVERRLQRFRDLVRDRHAASRQTEHDRVRPGIARREPLTELATGGAPIGEDPGPTGKSGVHSTLELEYARRRPAGGSAARTYGEGLPPRPSIVLCSSKSRRRTKLPFCNVPTRMRTRPLGSTSSRLTSRGCSSASGSSTS